ncbi:hypothetical protein CJP74_04475 [Psittacicella melopsittaci]|uniref:NAD kinase n=1 Tax=Psittacicella melopsittaci TaxID=2028576 RepID=A0A3A1Y4F1_9GAMM|nr:NAD(+)/NADH kinase [Psittacicella melopsittaci]RIY32445.1 hypothetical protein CJP74_04475 [Psittacicella melopsittaci]
MLNKEFNTFAIVGLPRNQQSLVTHLEVYKFFHDLGKKVYLDQQLRQEFPDLDEQVFADEQTIGANADLIICIGGDGNMLRAGLRFAKYNIPLIGVNKGNLGFLTDIDPYGVTDSLERLLNKDNVYIEERNTIGVSFLENDECGQEVNVLNEIAILGNRENRIVEVEVFVDRKFAFGMRGDGLIISTPTGSTAYNLSIGGPIVHPSLHAVILTPMNAHTLSSRPIVIPATSEIDILFKRDVTADAVDIYCDGVLTHHSLITSQITIKPTNVTVKMVHFNDYNYYSILAKKLNWAKRLF